MDRDRRLRAGLPHSFTVNLVAAVPGFVVLCGVVVGIGARVERGLGRGREIGPGPGALVGGRLFSLYLLYCGHLSEVIVVGGVRTSKKKFGFVQ